MIVNTRYQNFLYDIEVYDKLKSEWDKYFKKTFHDHVFTEWVHNYLPNGEEIKDGNPIYSALFESLKKAIRIIQVKHNQSQSPFIAWKDSSEWNGNEIDELVLCLQPDKTAFLESKKIIEDFVNGDLLPSMLDIANANFELLKDYSKSNLQSGTKPSNVELWDKYVSVASGNVHSIDIIIPLVHYGTSSGFTIFLGEAKEYTQGNTKLLLSTIKDLIIASKLDTAFDEKFRVISTTGTQKELVTMIFKYNRKKHYATIKVADSASANEILIDESYSLEVKANLEKITSLVESL